MWIGLAVKESAVGLTETTVLYVLSTMAQTCAALIAFLGTIAIFRLQRLRSIQDDAIRRIRDVLQTFDAPETIGFSDRQVIERARVVRHNIQSPTLPRSLELALRAIDHRDPEIWSAERLLQGFVFVNVIVIGGALFSFLAISFWVSHPRWGACLLIASVVAVSLLTLAMALEMVGKLESKLPVRLSKWLRRPPKSPSKNNAKEH